MVTDLRRIPIVLALALLPDKGAAQGPLAVPFGHAECLRDHASDYLATLGDPAMIFTGFCKLGIVNPTSQQVSEATTTNAFGSLVIVIENQTLPANEMSSLVILTRRQISCLRDHFDGVVRKSVGRLRTKTNEVPVDIALIDFSRC